MSRVVVGSLRLVARLQRATLRSYGLRASALATGSLLYGALLFGAMVSAVTGCQSAPADIRPWQPSDHTNSGEASGATLPRPGRANAANATGQVTGAANAATPRGLEEVTIAAWRTNCASCHGPMGRGDGPQAPMFTPRDLTDPAWQASVSDEQLFVSIQKGKNKMPGFSLPENVAHNLVALVRLLNRDRVNQPPPAAPSAASATTGSGPGSPAAQAPSAQLPPQATGSTTVKTKASPPAKPSATSTAE